MIIIRNLEKEDLTSLKVLLDELNDVLKSKHKISEKDINSNYIDITKYPEIYSNYVAKENDKMIGFLSMVFYKTFLHKRGTALINELIVAKSHRNKGIGKVLIEKAIQLAKRRGMDEIEVGTEISNVNAQSFYKKVGFNEEHVLLGKEFEI
ncbi:MAG: GNAT family N-acetyltransferase [Promethearchaeota archaeon]